MKYSDITIKQAYRDWFSYWFTKDMKKTTWQKELTNWVNENAEYYGAETEEERNELYRRLAPDKSQPQKISPQIDETTVQRYSSWNK